MNDIKFIKEVEETLSAKFGDNIRKVLLYGSRARGDAGPDSDYDILVVVEECPDWRMRKEISFACYDLDLKYDVITDVKTITVEELKSPRGRQPYILNALREGLAA